MALALSNGHRSLQTLSSSQGTDKMNKDGPISNQLPNDKTDALRLECWRKTRVLLSRGARTSEIKPLLHNGSIYRAQLIAAAVQELRLNHFLCGAAIRSFLSLSKRLIGPSAAWSRTFRLLSTAHTLPVMEMTRILLSVISVCHLGTKYSCPPRSQMMGAGALQKEESRWRNISTKGPKYCARCQQRRRILLLTWKVKGFKCAPLRDQYNNQTKIKRTPLLVSVMSELLAHGAWRWARWGPLWENSTQLRKAARWQKPTEAFSATKTGKEKAKRVLDFSRNILLSLKSRCISFWFEANPSHNVDIVCLRCSQSCRLQSLGCASWRLWQCLFFTCVHSRFYSNN